MISQTEIELEQERLAEQHMGQMRVYMSGYADGYMECLKHYCRAIKDAPSLDRLN